MLRDPAPDAAHLAPFLPDVLAILDGRDWIVTVRRRQVTFGAMTFLPRSPYPALGDVPPAAAAELFRLFGRAERAARELGADRVNVVAAMMRSPFVHFHLFPRYAGPLEREGRVWIDEDWPDPVVLRPAPTADDELARIREVLSAALRADPG